MGAGRETLQLGVEQWRSPIGEEDRLEEPGGRIGAVPEIQRGADRLGPERAGHTTSTVVPIAAATGRALMSASSSSACGSESATMPPPTPSHR